MKSSIKNILRRSFVYKRLTNPIYRARARMFDLKHNVNTAREVHLEELKIDSPNVAYGVFYAGTDARFFRNVLTNWDIWYEDFVFVDLGSGKGRAIQMASEFPFKRIIGVEFSSELAKIAERNLPRYRTAEKKCDNLEVVCEDAAAFSFPKEPLLVYMFNPFGRTVVSKVVKNIEDSYRGCPREIYIIYANPCHADLIKQSSLFEEINSDEWHSMYRSRSALSS